VGLSGKLLFCHETPRLDGKCIMSDHVVVLAVDDIELNLNMVQIMLGSCGDVAVVEARNGREALEVLQQRPDIDIVLLDLEMPVMDGFETLERIKSDDRFREIPVIVVTADRAEVTKILAMGANDFMAKPYDPEELRLRVMNHVRGKKLNELVRDMNSFLQSEVSRKTAELRKALNFSRKAEFEITVRLGRAAEFRDSETGMHIRRISELSWELAVLAGLSGQECDILRHAAPLHDVGKIGIPDRVLLKPGKLDADEFELMKTHTVIGSDILSDSGEFPVIKAGQVVALQHHEKWDGSGYPHGLSGTAIHVYGRIVMIADIFDALTSNRPYKKAFPIEKAIDIMIEGRGAFFDPELLDLFLDNLGVFAGIKEKYRDSGEEESAGVLLHTVAAVPGASCS
jgi:putative two-component system response regulator